MIECQGKATLWIINDGKFEQIISSNKGGMWTPAVGDSAIIILPKSDDQDLISIELASDPALTVEKISSFHEKADMKLFLACNVVIKGRSGALRSDSPHLSHWHKSAGEVSRFALKEVYSSQASFFVEPHRIPNVTDHHPLYHLARSENSVVMDQDGNTLKLSLVT